MALAALLASGGRPAARRVDRGRHLARATAPPRLAPACGRARPHSGHPTFSDCERHPDNETIPGVLIFRPESSLLYFNVDHVRDLIVERTRAEATPPSSYCWTFPPRPWWTCRLRTRWRGSPTNWPLRASACRPSTPALGARPPAQGRRRCQTGRPRSGHVRRRCGGRLSETDHVPGTTLSTSTTRLPGELPVVPRTSRCHRRSAGEALQQDLLP